MVDGERACDHLDEPGGGPVARCGTGAGGAAPGGRSEEAMICITKTSCRTSSFALVISGISDHPAWRPCGEARRIRRTRSANETPKTRLSNARRFPSPPSPPRW